MNIKELRLALATGGVSKAWLVANGRRFYIRAEDRAGGGIVLTRHSDGQPRLFSDAGAALGLLRDVGFGTVTVELAGWQPNQSEIPQTS